MLENNDETFLNLVYHYQELARVVAKEKSILSHWAFDLIYLLPIFLGIKSVFAIRKGIKRAKITAIHKALDKDNKTLVNNVTITKWCCQHYHEYKENMPFREKSISIKEMAKHINSADFSKGMKGYLRKVGESNEIGNAILSKYSQARQNLLIKQKRYSLLRTIFSALGVIPLFYTVYAHYKLAKKNNAELDLLSDEKKAIENILDPYNFEEDFEIADNSNENNAVQWNKKISDENAIQAIQQLGFFNSSESSDLSAGDAMNTPAPTLCSIG